jgi:hypothetical protein
VRERPVGVVGGGALAAREDDDHVVAAARAVGLVDHVLGVVGAEVVLKDDLLGAVGLQLGVGVELDHEARGGMPCTPGWSASTGRKRKSGPTSVCWTLRSESQMLSPRVIRRHCDGSPVGGSVLSRPSGPAGGVVVAPEDVIAGDVAVELRLDGDARLDQHRMPIPSIG